jgi:uncharacterized membrane protein
MSNQCPKCGQEAMTAMQKLMVRPHVCQHCGAEIRMNLIYTGLVSLLYFGLSVQALVSGGFAASGMVKVLVYTVIFMGICLFIPFETKKAAD